MKTHAHATGRELGESLCRSYLAALAFLGDAAQAEALVRRAIENLDDEEVTGDTIRDAVIRLLVQTQIQLRSAFPAVAAQQN